MEDNFLRSASLVDVVDGDTVDVLVDLGYRVYTKVRIRMIRINAPETKGITKIEGKTSKDFVRDVLSNQVSFLVKSYKRDGFRRWLGEIFIKDGDEYYCLNDRLVELGYAVKM